MPTVGWRIRSVARWQDTGRCKWCGGPTTGGVLRAREGGEQRVTPLELFFDLVYVFAITQLSHLLLDHPTVGGALQTLFLLLVVWWAWQYTTWFTNWFDPGVLSVRLLLGGMMLASLVMSVAIPEAFGERGLMFALAYVAIQVGRTGFAVLTLGASHPLGGGFRRILAWFAASGVLWVAGGLVEGGARYVLWLLALAVDYSGPATGRRGWAARARRSGLSRGRTSPRGASCSSSSPWASPSWSRARRSARRA